MSKILFTGAFVFSLALNLAVAGTLGWHWWRARLLPRPDLPAQEMPLTRQEWKQLRQARHGAEERAAMAKILAKRAEVFDLLVANPGDSRAAEKSVNELIAMRSEMEKQAFADLTRILANLPEEKRAQFLAFLKSRACRGPGMGMRHGGPRMMRCPGGSPRPQAAPPPDAKNFSRDTAPPPVGE